MNTAEPTPAADREHAPTPPAHSGKPESGCLDPAAVRDWANLTLPETWPDRGRGGWPGRMLRIFSHPFRRRSKVDLPEAVPGAEKIPAYALLEFHHLPNGNYSRSLTRGYITGFENAMLGETRRVRTRMVEDLSGFRSILDIGCGGGQLVGALAAEGRTDVWGLDPSPYLLKHAASDYPDGRFAQGIMEEIPFEAARFEAATVVFVFHEVPPPYIRRGLAEIARVLKPGGKFLVAEPSPAHFRARLPQAVRRFGWRGLWFWSLARMVHEPYVRAWHALDFQQEAHTHGLIADTIDEGMPIKYWSFRKAG